jgi:DNA-binding NarL/FixJ family response regulator
MPPRPEDESVERAKLQDVGAAPIRVAVVEDQRGIREGLAALIDFAPGFTCSGRFGSFEEALPRLSAQLADVVLVDLGLPGMSGIEGIRLAKERHPALALVVLSVYDDDDRIFDALCGGACGYLLKNTPPELLLAGLREAVSGGAPMSPQVARRVIAELRDRRPMGRGGAADPGLTPHETRLLQLLVEGHNYKTAARELSVTVNTVSFHIKHIYEKLQVHSKSEAVAKALRERLVE